MSSANCQLTSYDIKLPAYKVFNTTEKAICGTQHSTRGGRKRERGDSEEGELDYKLMMQQIFSTCGETHLSVSQR